MKTLTKIRESICKNPRVYMLAVTLLAFGLFVQAVHAKNSDYFPNTAQAVRFSTTIKIADLAQHINVADPGTLTTPRELLPVTRPQSTRASYVPELPAPELAAQFSFRPLRSPPITL